MAEWLYEAGIGEARAVLVEHGLIIEAAIERDDGTPRVGAIVPARLTRTLLPGRRAIVTLEGGGEAMIEPPPPGVGEGATFLAELVREPIDEHGAVKRARVRAAAPDAVTSDGPDLLTRLRGGERRVTVLDGHGPDLLEAAGWSELIEEAVTGEVAFPGGGLRISPTPAMTLIDVDGPLDPAALAIAGAQAAARAIRRMAIGGSIGIDLPTVQDRATRQAAAAAIDAVLPPPFERTAINGFGFVQVVRRRERPSLLELVRRDPVRAAALALLRRGERAHGVGPVTLIGAAPVIACIDAGTGWLEELARRAGAGTVLRPEPARPIWSIDAQRAPL